MWASSRLFPNLQLFSYPAPAIPPWVVDAIRLFFPGGSVLVFLLFLHLFYSLRSNHRCNRAFLHLHWNSRFSLSTFQAWAVVYPAHCRWIHCPWPHCTAPWPLRIGLLHSPHACLGPAHPAFPFFFWDQCYGPRVVAVPADRVSLSLSVVFGVP